jgi:hypothetical protein
MSNGYKVISQHGANARTRSRKFGTAAEADAYAATISPEVDGSTIPTLDCPTVNKAKQRMEGPGTYSRGYSWYGNQYAAAIEL